MPGPRRTTHACCNGSSPRQRFAEPLERRIWRDDSNRHHTGRTRCEVRWEISVMSSTIRELILPSTVIVVLLAFPSLSLGQACTTGDVVSGNPAYRCAVATALRSLLQRVEDSI